MDLVYTNTDWEDIGVIQAGEMEMEVGEKNTFELTVPKDTYPDLTVKSLVYFEGTEYGGIVNGFEIDTSEETITLTGYTWQGILDHKIIEPDAGEDYYVTADNDEAHSVVVSVLKKCDLLDLFTVPNEDSKITADRYQFARYATAYNGIKKMAADNGGKLRFRKGLVNEDDTELQTKVVIYVEPIADYSTDNYSSDQYEFTITQNPRQTNHLICLGQGELAERTVIHLYLDADGNVSETQTYTGIDEIVEVYENTNDDDDALLEDGTKHLKELYSSGESELQLNDDDTVYDIGDIVGATYEELGIEIKTSISSKVLTYDNGAVTIECKIGG